MKPASDETNSGPLELIPDLGVLGADHHHLGMYKPHDLELPRAPFDGRSRKSEEKGDPGYQTHQPSCCKIPVWSPAPSGHASNVFNRSLQVVNNSRFSEMSKRQCLHISYVSVPLERPPEAELLQYQPAVLVFTSYFESYRDSSGLIYPSPFQTFRLLKHQSVSPPALGYHPVPVSRAASPG